jgi:hypothetical protein
MGISIWVGLSRFRDPELVNHGSNFVPDGPLVWTMFNPYCTVFLDTYSGHGNRGAVK